MAYALRVDKKMPDISICLPGGERIDIKVRDSKRANRFIMRVNQQTSESVSYTHLTLPTTPYV